MGKPGSPESEKHSVCPSWYEDGGFHIRKYKVAPGMPSGLWLTFDRLKPKSHSANNTTELKVDSCLETPDKSLHLICAL